MSLFGILGVAWTVYSAKFLGAAPPRIVFLIFLALACSPFIGVLGSRVRVLFLIPSTLLVFLLYPFFSPHGLPFNRDVIYNFQVSRTMMEMSAWIPGIGSGAAFVQSSYPGFNIFNVEASVLLGLPLDLTYQWVTPVFRFLVLPPVVYAISLRVFDRKTAILGVFLYLGTAAVLFNVPAQQEFASPFVALCLLLFTYLLNHTESTGLPLRIGIVGFSFIVILTHHWSSYVFGAWLAGIAFMPVMLRRPDAYPSLRPARVLARYIIVLLLYVYFVAAPVVQKHLVDLQEALNNLIGVQPAPGRVSQLGRTFLPYELVWILIALSLLTILSLLTLRRRFARPEHTFLTTNLLLVLAMTVATLPFLASSFYFLPLRILEYSGLFLCPAAAWWIVNDLMPRLRANTVQGAKAKRQAVRSSKPFLIAILLLVFIYMGGNLVPVTTRDYFTDPTQLDVDSPRFIDHNAYDAALWARAHLNASRRVWGDDLVYSVFGGFGGFDMRFRQYDVFNGTNISAEAWRSLEVGDYVITDVYMTSVTPRFRGPDQPQGPLVQAQLDKFDDPAYFSRVYQDSIFTIYSVVNRPRLPLA